MTDFNPSPNPGDSGAEEGKAANIIYILYLVSLIFGVTAIIGVVIAYINRSEAPDWVASHYRFQIRTFWIGMLYGLIGGMTAFFVIGWFILLFVLVWWIVRCIKGMKYLGREQAYPDPTSWMFG